MSCDGSSERNIVLSPTSVFVDKFLRFLPWPVHVRGFVNIIAVCQT